MVARKLIAALIASLLLLGTAACGADGEGSGDVIEGEGGGEGDSY